MPTFMDPAVHDDPFPTFAEFRETGTGVGKGTVVPGFWNVSRYEDVERVYRHPRRFSSQMFWHLSGGTLDRDNPRHKAYLDLLEPTLLFHDPPAHTRLRTLVSRAFTPRAVEGMRTIVQRIVDDVLATVEPGVDADFMVDIARPIPVLTIAAMFGVPVEDHDRFHAWSKATAAGFEPILDPEHREAVMAQSLEFADYMTTLADERRRHPADDLLSALLAVEEAGDRLDAAECIAMVNLLFVAGNVSSTNLMGNGMQLLFDNPAVMDRLRDEPDRVVDAVEEMLRLEPPFILGARLTTEEVEIGGELIGPDELVITVLGAANRDPRRFADPDRFDVERGDKAHLTFAGGIHYCLGAALVRLEAQVLFRSLIPHFGRLAPAGPRRRLPYLISRGYEELPVRF